MTQNFLHGHCPRRPRQIWSKKFSNKKFMKYKIALPVEVARFSCKTKCPLFLESFCMKIPTTQRVFSCPGSSIPDLGQWVSQWVSQSVTATLEFQHKLWLLKLKTPQTFDRSDELKRKKNLKASLNFSFKNLKKKSLKKLLKHFQKKSEQSWR